MNHRIFKTTLLALSTSVCFMACTDQSGSSSETGNASADSASAMADTSMNNNMASTTAKKKLKATVEIEPAVKNPKYTMDKSGVYANAEVVPSYNGGMSAIENYINNHIEYPQPALDDSKEGKVSIKFTVDEKGKVTDVHSVGTKLGDGLDEEAARVVSSMPDWTPGTVKGKPVKVGMTLPIEFKIEQ